MLEEKDWPTRRVPLHGTCDMLRELQPRSEFKKIFVKFVMCTLLLVVYTHVCVVRSFAIEHCLCCYGDEIQETMEESGDFDVCECAYIILCVCMLMCVSTHVCECTCVSVHVCVCVFK